VKLGLVSDAHGNAEALDLALTALEPRVDAILFAGDAFSDHRFSNEVVARLLDVEATYVLGNHEVSLLGPAGRAAREAPHVRSQLLEHVRSRPSEAVLATGGRRVLMVHASPWSPRYQYLTPASRELDRCDELDVDFLVIGHSHLPFARRVGRTLVVNPGAVGRSDRPDSDDVGYAVLDTDSGQVEHVSFPNPTRAPVVETRVTGA
jgi:putative phosphoesterase